MKKVLSFFLMFMFISFGARSQNVLNIYCGEAKVFEKDGDNGQYVTYSHSLISLNPTQFVVLYSDTDFHHDPSGMGLVAEKGIADRFHFPGFMRGKEVYQCLKASDVYVMPSVSEPFGISPLEAMQVGTPSIISKQSGCAEILQHAIKTDYWDIDAMADAIYAIVKYPAMYKSLRELGREEVNNIKWSDAGLKVRAIYDKVIAERH